MVINRSLETVGFHGFPPFLSIACSEMFQSPPIIRFSTSVLDIKYVFKLCINSCCCRRSFGAYTLHKERFFALKFKSIEMILPIWSLWIFLTMKFSEGFNRVQTPLLCIDPCEKNMSPPHSLFQIFSSFGSEYVSCRKHTSQFWSFKKQKILLLFTRFLKPLTFIEITLHLPCAILI